MHYVPHVDYAFLLWFIYAASTLIMGKWSCYFFNYYFNRFFRVRFTLGSNEFLGCNSYY